jgi:hypothetical protein
VIILNVSPILVDLFGLCRFLDDKSAKKGRGDFEEGRNKIEWAAKAGEILMSLFLTKGGD